MVMKAIGLQRAGMRLDEAKGYLPDIRSPLNLLDVPAVQHRWYLFLTALHSCREIIKTTALRTPQGKQWFYGRENNTLKRDPLLLYLEVARGSDFHGLGGGAEPAVEGATYLGYEPNAGRINGKLSGAMVLEGDVSRFRMAYVLHPVKDERYPTIFAPPTEHLGRALTDASPAGVAEAGVAFYEIFLEEAWSRVR
jgi:hypothetical protein